MAPTRPDEIPYLTGRLTGTLLPRGISLLNGGGKFTPDGAIQYWPGNTFVCHLDRQSRAFEAIHELQEDLKKSVFNRFFTFLPPPSFHMTVYQGIAPSTTSGNGWPEGVPEGLPRDEVTSILSERLERMELPRSFRVKVDGLHCGYSITVSGADSREEDSLRTARAALRDATGITFPDFHDYVFHITLAYLIDWLSEGTARELLAFGADLGARLVERVGVIDLGPVEFCNFDTMHHFELVRKII